MTTTAPTMRYVDRWTALGCAVHLETRRADDLAPARSLVAAILADVDAVASRFRGDSDLSRVNRRAGRWVAVDPLLVAAVGVALDAAEQTDGLVHPLLGRRLVELGYDATFATLAERAARPDPPTTSASSAAACDRDAWRKVELRADAIRIPTGTALDLGATGKAWCTDLCVTALEQELAGDAVVSIGGDLRTAGPGAWEVGVGEHPGEAVDTTVELTGALATSSTRVRRWTRAGAARHHLVDPRTGRPVAEIWRTATVAHETCVAANVASTAAIVLADAALAWLEDRVPAARLVHRDGTLTVLGAWPGRTVEGGKR